MCGDVNSVITEEGGELEVWREMKDCIEYHSPILIQANLSFGKTSNPIRNAKGNTPSIDHLNHLIHYRNHLIDHMNHLIQHLNQLNNHLIRHRNHLNQIKLEDFLQSWQSNTASLFCEHCRKLGADQDSETEVSQSSNVLFTSIQVKMVSMQVSDVIDIISINRSVIDVKCHVNQNSAQTVPGSTVSREPQLLFLLPNHWKELHFSLV